MSEVLKSGVPQAWNKDWSMRAEVGGLVGGQAHCRPGTVTELLEHWSRVQAIVNLNPWSSQTNDLFN